jgi:hypothetical protein
MVGVTPELATDRTIDLGRMEIEEAGPNPARLAAAIHGQLGNESGPVPVHDIATALDIDEIRAEPLINLEGALLARPERPKGKILVNGNSSRQRQRFTISHELGHFLNVWHQPTGVDGFHCSRDDIQTGRWDANREATRHTRQEAEANRFAIELLLPRARLTGALSAAPDLDVILSAASENDVSRAATARRFVELHDATIAIAFSHKGILSYWAKQDNFPRVSFWKAEQMPELPLAVSGANLSPLQDTDPVDWLVMSANTELTVQTLHQQNGYAMTLLVVETGPNADDDGIEDTFERFSGLNS